MHNQSALISFTKIDVLFKIHSFSALKKIVFFVSLFSLFLLAGFLIDIKQANAFIVSDLQAENLLRTTCGSTTETYHIVYLNPVRQQDNSTNVTFTLKGRSMRCPGATSSAWGVGNRLTSFTGTNAPSGVAPHTFYSGLTLSPGQLSSIYSHGTFTINNLPVGTTRYDYSYDAQSFGDSFNTGTSYAQFTVQDVCANVAGIQYPSPPSGYYLSGSNCYRNPTGSLSCGTITPTSITLNWTTGYTTNAVITRDSPLSTVGSIVPRDSSGTRTDSGRSPGVSYTYRLRNNSSTGAILASVTCSTTRAPSVVCPSYPPYSAFSDPNVVVNLSDAGKPNNQSVPTAPPSGSWSGTVLLDTRSTSTGLTARREVRDTSSNNPVLTYGYSTTQPISQVLSVKDEWGQAPSYDASAATDGTAELDYTPFMNYPYDPHTATVTYQRSVFTRTNYYTYTRTRYYNYERPNTSAAWTEVSSGNNGWSSSRTSYTDSSPYWGNSVTRNGPEMPPCYPREFDAKPTAGSARWEGTRETPTGSTFSFTIPTNLSYSRGGSLRTATIVNSLSYTVSYYAEGYSNPNFSGTINKTVNITNTSRSNNVTGKHSPATLSDTVSVTIPTIEAGDRVCWTVSVAQPKGSVRAGSVRGQIWNQNGPAATSSTECTPLAIDQPYSRYYGTGVFAGGGIMQADGTCSAVNSDASLKGTMRIDQLSGNGTQYDAYALGQIEQVQPFALASRNPLELSFANYNTPASVAVANRLFGGGFQSVACANDYFGDVANNTSWDTTTQDINLAELESGKHYYEGDVTIYGLIPDIVESNGYGRRVVVYVKGDVTLGTNSALTGPTGRIGYANNTNWQSLQAIPSLYIIVEGNIRIDNDIREIDGVLVAQSDKNGENGVIETCSNGKTSLMPTGNNIGALTINCRNQLFVNGSLSARQIHNLRMLGSLRESTVNEYYTATRAAESVLYNPLIWLTSTQLSADDNIQIDSFVQLPPSL